MNTVRLRLISMSLAALLTVAAVYLAITQKFSTIAELFVPSIDPIVVVEQPKTVPPVTPPKTPPTPPVVQRQAAMPDAAPTPFVEMLPAAEPAPPAATVITDPTWIERPSGRDFARYYPERALARDREGRVVLDCVVAANGRIGCTVSSEEPGGWGFGDAALRIAQSFRMSPRLENGQATEGGRVRVPINFRLN